LSFLILGFSIFVLFVVVLVVQALSGLGSNLRRFPFSPSIRQLPLKVACV
jgi:hypothetical protein